MPFSDSPVHPHEDILITPYISILIGCKYILDSKRIYSDPDRILPRAGSAGKLKGLTRRNKGSE
jgi:hypothetical protein